MRTSLAALTALSLALVAAPARAEKSNEVRPIPPPVMSSYVESGLIVLMPRGVIADYKDSLFVLDSNGKKIPNQTYDYHINSAGFAIDAQLGLRPWASIIAGFEGYRKFGSILGPSVGDPSRRVRADVTGYAFKLAAHGDFRIFTTAKDPADPNLADVSINAHARVIGDIFSQDQRDPYFQSAFSERSFEYRAGATVQLYLLFGFFLAAFGGVDGVVFSGSRDDTITGKATVHTPSKGGAEQPHPYFGANVFWGTAKRRKSVNEGLSGGVTVDYTPKDASGFGGRIITASLGYVLKFDIAPKGRTPQAPALFTVGSR